MSNKNRPTMALRLQVLSDNLDASYLAAKDLEVQHRMEWARTGNKVNQMSADYQEGFAHGIRKAQNLVAEAMKGVK